MKKRKLYNIAFMGDKDHGCDIISTLESWGGSNYYSRTGNDIEYAYFINDLGTIDFIHNSAFLSEGMKNFYFLFWHDYNIECHLKVGESINYGGQDYDVDSILFDANNRCIVYKLKSFGIGVEYITNNELTPVEEYPMEEEENNMKRKLAIRGHATRGKEVIELLGMLGAKNNCASTGYNLGLCYLIDDEFDICAHYFGYDDYEDGGLNIFTLEEFLEKYPYKVGDKIIDIADEDPGIITAMKWDEDVSDMKYHIAFDNGDMGWYTNDTIELLNLGEGKTMNKKLAIKGHSTRGNEVIELLEMMGGKNVNLHKGNFPNEWKSSYYIYADNTIQFGMDENLSKFKFVIFTLEEFLEKYPFKVGDKVFLYDNITEGCVTGMEWDEDKGTVKYCVYTSSECWCDVKDLLKWNNVDLVERHYMDNMEEKDKTKAPNLKGEDYSDKRFGYKIPNGYEFDVVVDGKIFLKPIKPKYPTTYEECCDMLNANEFVGYELMTNFPKLINARNAYWKIAGEEMGLGKPWEPDWDEETNKFTISNKCNKIYLNNTAWYAEVLSFPTAEMRDAFYENFKKEIEQCKELL